MLFIFLVSSLLMFIKIISMAFVCLLVTEVNVTRNLLNDHSQVNEKDFRLLRNHCHDSERQIWMISEIRYLGKALNLKGKTYV